MGLKQMASEDLILPELNQETFLSSSFCVSWTLSQWVMGHSEATCWSTCMMSQQNQNKSLVYYG